MRTIFCKLLFKYARQPEKEKMENNILSPKKALNKAFLKQKPLRIEIDNFKQNLIALLDGINEAESEENAKIKLRDFLLDTYYKGKHEINTKNRNDLVIHTEKTANSSVGVIIEAKAPKNITEFPTKEKLNTKAMQELVLYYLREHVEQENSDIKNLIITNGFEWFIFEGSQFYEHFYQDTQLLKEYKAWASGQKDSAKTAMFYRDIAKKYIAKKEGEIIFTYFNTKDYEEPLKNNNLETDKKLKVSASFSLP